MALAQTLTEWARARGQEMVELDADGGIQLVADQELAVDIGPVADEPGFSLTASVGPLPRDGRHAVMEELLMANLAGQGTGGACLAVDMLRDEIVQCRTFHTDDLSPAVFDRELTRFVDVLRFWRDRLQAGRLGAAGSDAAPEGPGVVRI